MEVDVLLRLGHENPSMYYLLLKGWVAFFGPTELSLRFPSAAFGSLLLYSSYRLGLRLANEQTGKLLCVLIGLSPPLVYFSQEVRMYSLFLFCVLEFFLAIETGLKTPRQKIVFLIWSFLLMSLHLFGLFVFGGIVLLFFLARWIPWRGNQSLFFVVFFFFILFSHRAFAGIRAYGIETVNFIPALTLQRGFEILQELWGRGWFLFVALLFVGCVRIFRKTRFLNEKLTLVPVFFLFSLSFIFLFSLCFFPMTITRYLLFLLPFGFLIVVFAIDPSQKVHTFALIAIIGLNYSFTVPQYQGQGRGLFSARELAEFYLKTKQEGEPLVFDEKYSSLEFAYYTQEQQSTLLSQLPKNQGSFWLYTTFQAGRMKEDLRKSFPNHFIQHRTLLNQGLFKISKEVDHGDWK